MAPFHTTLTKFTEMQSRFVANGTNKNEDKVILAYELNEGAFRLELRIIPLSVLDKEQIDFLDKNWVAGEDFKFPEGAEVVTLNPNDETILPEEILSAETGKIRGKQNEWAYQLLTAKLWESYLQELEELIKKSNTLTQYDRQLFDDAKSFWERVLEHRKERDISQERLDKIKDDVNSVFEKLKAFRKTESAEFEAASAKLRDEVVASIETIKAKADEKANFKTLLEDLKTLQAESRKKRFSKNDDTLMKKAFDSAFHHISEQRNHFFTDKNAARIKGLNEVIRKMEASLDHDKKDLEYFQRKANSPNVKALELQLNHVKIRMLNENMASKEEKLKDIRATLAMLTKQSNKAAKKSDAKAELNAPNTQEEALDESASSASPAE